MKHTPAPWSINNNASVWGKDPAKNTVCIAKLPPDAGLAARAANAKIIQIAPALLAMLQELLDSPNAKSNDLWDRARALVAKAA